MSKSDLGPTSSVVEDNSRCQSLVSCIVFIVLDVQFNMHAYFSNISLHKCVLTSSDCVYAANSKEAALQSAATDISSRVHEKKVKRKLSSPQSIGQVLGLLLETVVVFIC